mgnify:FL=1
MKKLPLIVAVAFLFLPTLAQADLQCFSAPSYTAYVNVQSAAQCVSHDPNGALFDTSSNTWRNPQTGTEISNPSYTTRTTTSAPTSGTNPTAFCSGGKCTYTPLEPLYGLPTSYGPNSGSFASLIGSSFKLLIGAGALIAVVMLVLGALTYMFSDIVGNKKKALDRIRGAMWAIVLLVSSYLILVTINPDLVKFSLDLNVANNYNSTPNLSGTATPSPIVVKPEDLKEGERRCAEQGGTLHSKPDGTYLCQ